MTRIAHSRRGLVRGLSLAAVALLMLAVAPVGEASATSLITRSASPLAKQASEGLTTEVRGGHGHGGGGWHGGGHGGWHGGWHRGGGGWHGGWHGGWRGGYFHHRHFYGGYRPYYYGGYYPYYYHPYCRIVWTYWGPRRICGYHHWYGWHRRWYWHRRYW
jgi:hypothetical protein